MRLICFFAATLSLAAQPVHSAKFDEKQFSKALGLDTHIHMFGNCKGAADGVYMRSGKSYYACINGQNVCNKDPGEIPDSLMRAFDRSRDAFDAKAKQFKTTKVVRSGSLRTTPQEMPAPAEAFPAPRPTPAAPLARLPDDRAAAVSVGLTRDQVVEAIGKPHTRISGDYEKFSYLLQSGKTLSVEFDSGRVSRVREVSPW